MSRKRWGAVLAALALTIVLVPATAPSALARHGHAVDRIDLPVGWQPEGVTTDGKQVFSGSLATGSILRANPRNGVTHVLPQSATGKPAVGLDFDKRRGIIWVAGGSTGEIRAQQAGSGRLLATYTFPAAASVFINDLVVTRGAVYATDSSNARLGVVPLTGGRRLPPSGEISTLPLGGDFVQLPGFNANGIVSSHGQLLVIQSNTGSLFRVDKATGNATTVAVTGSLANGDGLELDGDTLYVCRNADNLVAVVDLASDLSSGSVVDELTADPPLETPSTATLVGHNLYVANARFNQVPAGQEATADYWLTRLPAFEG